jgi:asparagine synthetase B (glutamine-hydrolysing)
VVGIAGLISKRASGDSQDIVQRMSRKLAHRGEETTYSFTLSDGSIVIISARSHQYESLDIKTESNGIHLIEGREQAETFQIKGNHKEVEFRRHPRSMKPLYYAEMDQAIHFSNERKALWEIGVQSSESLQPGQRLKVTGLGGASIIDDDEERRLIISRDMSHGVVIKRLTDALKSSFTRIAGRRVGVLFSGGVDSSLVALA